MKENIWLSKKLKAEALFSFKNTKREVSKEIRNSKARHYHSEFTIDKHNSRKMTSQKAI